jgi:hypothetical protein
MPQQKMVNFVVFSRNFDHIEQNLERKYNDWQNKHPNADIVDKVVKMRTNVIDIGTHVTLYITMSVTIFYTEKE